MIQCLLENQNIILHNTFLYQLCNHLHKKFYFLDIGFHQKRKLQHTIFSKYYCNLHLICHKLLNCNSNYLYILVYLYIVNINQLNYLNTSPAICNSEYLRCTFNFSILCEIPLRFGRNLFLCYYINRLEIHFFFLRNQDITNFILNHLILCIHIIRSYHHKQHLQYSHKQVFLFLNQLYDLGFKYFHLKKDILYISQMNKIGQQNLSLQ